MNITDQLARVLAKALLHEMTKRRRLINHPWFQTAAWALVDYRIELDEANKIQVHY